MAAASIRMGKKKNIIYISINSTYYITGAGPCSKKLTFFNCVGLVGFVFGPGLGFVGFVLGL